MKKRLITVLIAVILLPCFQFPVYANIINTAYLGDFLESDDLPHRKEIEEIRQRKELEKLPEFPKTDFDITFNLITTPAAFDINTAQDITSAFTDPNFLAAVRSATKKPTGSIYDTDVVNVTKLNVGGKRIQNLAGIEYFSKLKSLDCHNNMLTTLDLSKNTELESLDCNKNQLATLDLSVNTALKYLDCNDNKLTALDVSNNTAITTLRCSSNMLNELNVSQNKSLLYLQCFSNQLKVLDVSQNTALQTLNFRDNQLTSLDVSQNAFLKNLYCYRNKLTVLDVSKNTLLEELNCSRNELSALDVSKNSLLKALNCYSNNFDTINVSKNPSLELLDCTNNPLKTLDVSKNTMLKELFCGLTQLTSLDLSNNNLLEYLDCYENGLTSLNLSKAPMLIALYCMENQLTSLDLSNNNLLEYLDCYENGLTSLDLSKAPIMQILYCNNNQLTKLTLPKDSALNVLDCSDNKLSVLNVSEAKSLSSLYCTNNELTMLDVSKNAILTWLSCYNNRMKTIDRVIGWKNTSVDSSTFNFYPQLDIPGSDATSGIYSTNGSAYIDLENESIVLTEDINTIVAYSVNKGKTWKKGSLPTGDKFKMLFNKPLELWLLDDAKYLQLIKAKSQPTQEVSDVAIKFPLIEMRPKAEKLKPYYLSDTWLLVPLDVETPEEAATKAKNGYDYLFKNNMNWGLITKDGLLVSNGLKNEICFLKSSPQAVYDKDTNQATYIPASKVFRLSVNPFGKPPVLKFYKGKLKIKKGMCYQIDRGEVKYSVNGTTLYVEDELKDAEFITYWVKETGKKPASRAAFIKVP